MKGVSFGEVFTLIYTTEFQSISYETIRIKAAVIMKGVLKNVRF